MKPSLRFERLAALIALCMASSSAMAQGLPKEFRQALARAGVPPHSVAVVVQAVSDAGDSAQTIAKHRADSSFNPASVMKLVTTYAALDQLGEGFTWKNRVYLDGTLENGVLQGNLVLRGSGDPKFVLERVEDLFRQLQAKGLREVRGDIVLDRSVFDLPERNPAEFDDEPLRPYNVAPDGLLVNFKSLILTFTPDLASKRVLVRTEPPISRVDLPVEVSVSYGPCADWRSSLQADFSQPDRVSFAGRYPLACGEKIWPVAYIAPKQYAGRVLDAMWRKSGGQLTGSVRDGALPSNARLWHTADSLPLADIMADVNKFSNNVMAQQMFLTLSSELPSSGRTGSFAASQASLAAWWR